MLLEDSFQTILTRCHKKVQLNQLLNNVIPEFTRNDSYLFVPQGSFLTILVQCQGKFIPKTLTQCHQSALSKLILLRFMGKFIPNSFYRMLQDNSFQTVLQLLSYCSLIINLNDPLWSIIIIFFLVLANAGRTLYLKDKNKSDCSSYGSATLPIDTS